MFWTLVLELILALDRSLLSHGELGQIVHFVPEKALKFDYLISTYSLAWLTGFFVQKLVKTNFPPVIFSFLVWHLITVPHHSVVYKLVSL